MKQTQLNTGEWEISLKCFGGTITVIGATLEDAQSRMNILLGGAC